MSAFYDVSLPYDQLPWAAQPADERFVDIYLTFPDGQQGRLTQMFPLSVLRHYSKRARDELPKLGEGVGPLDWILHWPYDENRGVCAAFIAVLRWFRLGLPGNGFSTKFKDRRQLTSEFFDTVTIDTIFCLPLTMQIFDLASPLNRPPNSDTPYDALPRKVYNHVCKHGVTVQQLILLYSVTDNQYHGARRKASRFAAERWGRYRDNNNAFQADVDAVIQARANNAILDQDIIWHERKTAQNLTYLDH